MLIARLLVLSALLAISSCGMARTVEDTSESLERFECMSRNFKGEPPCENQAD